MDYEHSLNIFRIQLRTKLCLGQPAMGAHHKSDPVSLAVFQSPTGPLWRAPFISGHVDQESYFILFKENITPSTLQYLFSMCKIKTIIL